MNKMQGKETIVYGGAFNPPTVAHQAILQACVDYCATHDVDVWLLPSANRADKEILIPFDRRVELCHALGADVVKRGVVIDVITRELDRGIPTQTHDTVLEFADAYRDRSFRWVFGSDSVATMHEWRGGDWMLEHLPMLIVERPGFPIGKLGAYACILSVPALSVSSTLVRERMATGQSYEDLVGEHVGRVLTVR